MFAGKLAYLWYVVPIAGIGLKFGFCCGHPLDMLGSGMVLAGLPLILVVSKLKKD